LDGLRAVSVVVVIGCHFAYAHAELDRGAVVGRIFDGDLGVRIFFVISGFLITTLMLQEKKRYGNVSLKNFYLRRMLRLFPVQYAFVAFLVAIALVMPVRASTCGIITAATFTRNYACFEWIDGHFWSLAVEEQFYLIWPIALVALRQRSLLLFAVVLILVAPLSRAVQYHLDIHPYGWLTSNPMR
jgi:peptidoglycan/LPS O-acetylase OafA/YrhL